MTRFQLAPVTSVPAPSPVPATVDTALVPGLRLPQIPGLPGADTPAPKLRDIGGPPAPGSAEAKADMAVVKGAQLLRTPEGDAWAVRMAKDGVHTMWLELARREATLTGAPQEWLRVALVASSLAVNGAASVLAKQHYKRDRPFVVDPTIDPPVHRPSGNSSYPSGHASSAYAAARVIARMRPDLANEAYSLAQQVAVSRVYAGVHFPTDVVSGAMLGTAVAESVLRVARRSWEAPAAA